jgi:hypothetical protein
MWLKVEGFVGLVKQWWDLLARKLKALKLDLKKWNEVFCNVERKKRNLLEELWVFDVIEEGRALGAEEKTKKVEVLSELESSTLMEGGELEAEIKGVGVKGWR